MKVRKLLVPFSWLYGCITWVRNFLYDNGILKSQKFKVPVICVGNLSTGGTGKTPHVEYIIELLKNTYIVAVLSRGYGRSTSGFIIAKPTMDAEIIGDEPYQYSVKFPETIVTVGENRVSSIKKILTKHPGTDIILMDDGFQHRAVKAGLNILLTAYGDLFTHDILLPAGNLRENKNGYKRAELIVITKCPMLSEGEKQNIIKEIKPQSHQKVLFSDFIYDALISFNEEKSNIQLDQLIDLEVLLVTGIANPQSILTFLSNKVAVLHTLKFKDHHIYTKEDIRLIQRKFDNIASPKKVIITTEKDYMRMRNKKLNSDVSILPFYYLPVKVNFDSQNKQLFNTQILDYVRKDQRNS